MYNSLGMHMPACYLPDTLLCALSQRQKAQAQGQRQQAHSSQKRAHSLCETRQVVTVGGDKGHDGEETAWRGWSWRKRLAQEFSGVKDGTQSFRKGVQVRQLVCTRVT